MNIPVQKNLPSNNQGRPGDMVLVVHPNGMYLYVKGNNAWGSLRLNTKGIGRQKARNDRRRLQESVRAIIVHDGSASSSTAAEHGDGTIAGGGGVGQPETSSGGHEPR